MVLVRSGGEYFQKLVSRASDIIRASKRYHLFVNFDVSCVFNSVASTRVKISETSLIGLILFFRMMHSLSIILMALHPRNLIQMRRKWVNYFQHLIGGTFHLPIYHTSPCPAQISYRYL